MEVELHDIHKYYGTVHANRGVNLKIASGTIHGILGENGAGKSTLMKILAGYAVKSSGQILLDGRPVTYGTPAAATGLGIGMLYQDPLDFLPMSVLDNFSLGQLGGISLDRRQLRNRLRTLCSQFDFELDPGRSLDRFTVGERQQMELLRLLSLDVALLILDEPTTGISTLQKQKLFAALRKLAANGMTILLVSHKLEDIETLCDRVTVLRQGEVVGEMDRTFDLEQLLQLMFGTLPPRPPRCAAPEGRPVLGFENVFAKGGRAGLNGCSLTIHQGEVVGLAGLEGSGQGVFLRLAAGLERPASGTISLHERPVRAGDHHKFLNEGGVFLPAARLEEGLIGELTITEHCALTFPGYSVIVPWDQAARKAAQQIENFKIRGSPFSSAQSLSGGNQQRLLLSLMPPDADLMLMEQPTRGLDMESAQWIWTHLQSLCSQGSTIVFSSAELDEIMAVADRVLVFFDGTVVRDLRTAQCDVDDLARAIAGK